MRLPTPRLWIPCVLGAVALHLLVLGAWFAPRLDSRERPGREEPIAFRLTLSPPEQEPIPYTDEEGENERVAHARHALLLDALQTRDAREPWEGEYNTGAGFTGTHLLLTIDGFAAGDWTCFGEHSRWGSLVVDEDSVTLRPDARGGPAVRYFVMPWRGWTYLVQPTEMRDYLEQALSGFLEFQTRGPGYLHMEQSSLPDRDCASDGYCALWSSLPHVEVVIVREASGPTPRFVEFEMPEQELAEAQQLTLYWDADSTGCVRAIERERHGRRVQAFLDGCDAIRAGEIAVGTTFTRLPRLR